MPGIDEHSAKLSNLLRTLSYCPERVSKINSPALHHSCFACKRIVLLLRRMNFSPIWAKVVVGLNIMNGKASCNNGLKATLSSIYGVILFPQSHSYAGSHTLTQSPGQGQCFVQANPVSTNRIGTRLCVRPGYCFVRDHLVRNAASVFNILFTNINQIFSAYEQSITLSLSKLNVTLFNHKLTLIN